MAKKKTEELEVAAESAEAVAEPEADETAVQASSDDSAAGEPAEETAPEPKKPKAKRSAEKPAAAESAAASDKTSKPVRGKRAEKIGVVSSDKMTNTVVVRVDRLVKHPIYRKYVKKRKKFMAHDETGASIGDKVRIVETRPMSARKRWRVVEIIQKAEL